MPKCKFLDRKTGEVIEGLDFGGPEIYKVKRTFVYAPKGGTSLSVTSTSIILEPLGLEIPIEHIWKMVNMTDSGLVSEYAFMENTLTGQSRGAIRVFNPNGFLYRLPCEDEWVLADCGGYKLQDNIGVANNNSDALAYTLLGTDNTLNGKFYDASQHGISVYHDDNQHKYFYSWTYKTDGQGNSWSTTLSFDDTTDHLQLFLDSFSDNGLYKNEDQYRETIFSQKPISPYTTIKVITFYNKVIEALYQKTTSTTALTYFNDPTVWS